MFDVPDGCLVDSREQWMAVHYGHPMRTVYKDEQMAMIHCDQCGRAFVGFPRKRGNQ